MTTDTATPDTTATTTAVVTDYYDSILRALNVLMSAGAGVLLIDGEGRDRAELKCEPDQAPMTVLPKFILDALDNNDSHVKIVPSLLSDDGREPVATAILFARFRPRVSFDRDRDPSHYVAEPDRAKIRDALAGFLSPVIKVDALGEITFWWPLREPLRDMAKARALQRQLGERLGSETAIDIEMSPRPTHHGPGFAPSISRMLSADDPAGFISLGGLCKNAGPYGPLVGIAMDAARAYSLDEIERALTPPTTTITTTTRRGARNA